MSERAQNQLSRVFKEKVKPLGRKVAFPLSSVILAVAAACTNGEGEPTPTATSAPTFTPEPTATETTEKPKCLDDYADYTIIKKYSPESVQSETTAKLATVSFSGGLYLINLDASQIIKLADNYDGTEEVIWSPKGNLLIAKTPVGYDGPKYDILNLNGERLATIEDARSVSWSQDGTSVFYDEYSGIYELNLESGKACQIIESTYNNSDLYPVLSNDGSKLIFAHKEDNYHIMLLDINRNEIPYIGDSRFQNEINKSFKELIEIPYGYPPEEIRFQWTPDNSKVVFSLTKEGDKFPTIFVADVINNSVSEINTNNIYPFSTLDIDLSNDGTKIAFFDELVGLYVVNIDGSDLKKIYQGKRGCWVFPRDLSCLNPPRSESINKFRDKKPRWSPDDKQIGFIDYFKSFYIVDVDGLGELRSISLYDYDISGNPASESVSWSP